MASIRKHKLIFDERNVFILGLGHIPLHVIFTVSLGNSFGFPMGSHEIGLDHYGLAYSKIREEIAELGTELIWKRSANSILDKIIDGKIRVDNFRKSDVLKFIKRSFNRSIRFLKARPHILVSQADKGGKAVIMHRAVYSLKMSKYMESNVSNHTYFKCDSLTLCDVSSYVERKYGALILLSNGFLKIKILMLE